MKIIKRTNYLELLKRVKNTPDIKVITGVRRSGKSKLLESFISEVEKNDSKANIIHLNLQLSEFEDLLEYHALEEYVEKRYKKEKNNYLFIDEVQMCNLFEKTINSLHAKEKFDIYVTGSNAFLQSSDLATLFVGRTFTIPIFPFSFQEFLKYYGNQDNIYSMFDRYLKEGGMSGSYLYSDIQDKYSYISNDVFNTLIVRDIKDKYNIRNSIVLDKLIDFMMNNVGNIVSPKKISDTLNSSGIKNDHKTIRKYIDYLCRSYAFYRIRRYDIKGKRYLSSDDKYYLSDHSFRYARLGTKNLDYGHILENIVAIELLRRGYELYIGKLYEKEIDFVAIKRDQTIYIQVAETINDEKTFNREIDPLLRIKDAYPKMIITRTYHDETDYEGIRIVDISQWLLEE